MDNVDVLHNRHMFRRAIRRELGRISIAIKQLEFRLQPLKGGVRKRLREEVNDLKRMKDAIVQRLRRMGREAERHLPTAQLLREEISRLQMRCQQLKAQDL
ncbi:MAG: hypothetical protein J0L97_08160 [Alphaproteobacteria bacterium]|nr:hypothetical protein [Alphaproteobacteria bacterium]